ncbi:hypothetical protein ACJJTC_005275 [Scirpophaga incertulas]
MSTRSGKRLHNSSQHISDNEALKSVRRTRNRHLKENNCEDDKVIKVKRKNYVSYPSEDDIQDHAGSGSVIRASHKTLRELNVNCSPSNNDIDSLAKCVRLTRRTKKFAEHDESNGVINIVNEENEIKKQAKKKKKKLNSDQSVKKSKRNKKKKESTSDVININNHNISTDSFHSAAESPVKQSPIKHIEMANGSFKASLRRASKRNSDSLNENIDILSKKQKLSIPMDEMENIESNCEISKNNEKRFFDTTFEKEIKNNNKSDIKKSFDKSDTFVEGLDSTYDKNNSINAPIDKPNNRISLRSSKISRSPLKSKYSVNSQEEKQCKEANLIKTSATDTNLNTTFQKLEGHCDIISETSLVSSDDAINLTFDKPDNSHITITSDDSSSENIMKTPVILIENSVGETGPSNSSVTDVSPIKTIENLSTEKLDVEVNITAPVTLLKREGTFTIEGSEVSSHTPVKHTSPSLGYTPCNISKNSQKVLNTTHSIEKPGRRSSLVEQTPKITKVFVITLSSFVVLESNRLGRKRSFTHTEEDARVKRSRQTTVQRLSRSRSTSAAPKLSESVTPSKRQQTPSKDKPSRTKLPNFAALHQRQFAKMESLDECQERKAKRARQLLTPTGSITVLERISPKNQDTTNADSSKPAPQKLGTPSKTRKPFTLEPGYTRFGFKMVTGANPFSMTCKTDVKPKAKVVNSATTRQPSYPSLAGATSRKDVAKQTVMREKSFTSLSDKRTVKRMENRTVIKGVRTNRRFELQMRLRDLNA